MPKHAPKIEFSLRELAVIRLICEQKTSKEIAKEMDRSWRTIENVRQLVIKKTKVKNNAGLVMYAIINKLAPLDPAMKTKIAVRVIADYGRRKPKGKSESKKRTNKKSKTTT